MQKKWDIHTTDTTAAERIQGLLACHPATASLLAQRDLKSEAALQRFLHPSLHHLQAPFCLAGMHQAVSRLDRVIRQREKILIFGDYDVDGVTATILLYQFMKEINADVGYYIPDRTTEGYGLKSRHITDLAIPGNISVLLTVDCGISSHEAVQCAQENNIDVIITDHHDMPSTQPAARAIVNPKRADCSSDLSHLSGVGIAFYLAMALRKHLRETGFFNTRAEPNLKKYCDLVALGTVADMVPMVQENRILTLTGLGTLRSAKRPGIKALAQACGLDPRHINTQDIAFRLGPRINAAGRMDHAGTAAQLLQTPDLEEAVQHADRLNHFNRLRQKEEERVLNDILARIERQPDLVQKTCLVFAGTDWHAGVVGIVAARLTRRYFKPTVLISVQDNTGKGSARSIPGVDIRSALEACRQHLHGFGGHPMAAGLQLPADRIEPFRHCLDRVINQSTSPRDFIPKLGVDYVLNLSDITPNLLDEIVAIGPFGSQNPEPVFMTRDIHVRSSKIVGRTHRRMQLASAVEKKGPALGAIQFNADQQSLQKKQFEKMAYHLQWNRWNGKKSIQLLIQDIKFKS